MFYLDWFLLLLFKKGPYWLQKVVPNLPFTHLKKVIFGVAWRSRSDVVHLLTNSLTYWTLAVTWLMWPCWMMIPWEDFTDEDDDDDGDGGDDDGDDDGYLVMKVILWWNLSKDESYLVMKVMIVKEVMKGDVSS